MSEYVVTEFQIEEREDGFHLILVTDEGERFDFSIQEIAKEFHDSVRGHLGLWLMESET